MIKAFIALCVLIGVSSCASNPIKTVGKLGWVQPDPIERVSTYTFEVSIDGSQFRILQTLCKAIDDTTSSCETTLPPLSLGRHDLSLKIFGQTPEVKATLLVTKSGLVFQ